MLTAGLCLIFAIIKHVPFSFNRLLSVRMYRSCSCLKHVHRGVYRKVFTKLNHLKSDASRPHDLAWCWDTCTYSACFVCFWWIQCRYQLQAPNLFQPMTLRLWPACRLVAPAWSRIEAKPRAHPAWIRWASGVQHLALRIQFFEGPDPGYGGSDPCHGGPRVSPSRRWTIPSDVSVPPMGPTDRPFGRETSDLVSSLDPFHSVVGLANALCVD